MCSELSWLVLVQSDFFVHGMENQIISRIYLFLSREQKIAVHVCHITLNGRQPIAVDTVQMYNSELKQTLIKRYRQAKTDRGRKWYKSKDLPFALNRLYCIFTFKGTCS